LEFRTTPEIEGALALRRFRDELLRAEANPYDWKWAIIAGHNAIQNFMVCALDSPSRTDLFSDRYNKAFAKWWYGSGGKGKPPAIFMAVFMELYERLSPPFNVSKDMDALNHWRNDFIHFAMNSWAVSVRILPQRFLAGLRVIKHAGWNPGRFEWQSSVRKAAAQQTCRECVEVLERLKVQYSA